MTRVNPGEGPHNVADTEGFPIEKVWAERHPDVFEPVYGVADRDPLFRIYRLRARRPEESVTGIGFFPSFFQISHGIQSGKALISKRGRRGRPTWRYCSDETISSRRSRECV